MTSALADVMAVGVARRRPRDAVQCGEAEWVALLEDATLERATGFLVWAADAGTLVMGERQRSTLLALHERELADCLRLEALLLQTLDVLAPAVDVVRLLKGPAVARRFYPSAAWRTFGDIDLAVRGRDWDAAARALTSSGFVRRYDDPRPGFTARFGKGACFVSPAGLEIDLHRTFVAGPYGLAFDADELFEHRDAVVIGDVPVATLTPAAHALHAAVHAVLGSREPRLVALRDLAEIIDVHAPGEAVRELAVAWHMAHPLAAALTEARARLDADVGPSIAEWAANYRPRASERRAMASYTSPRRSYAAQAVAGVAAVRGIRPRFAYMRALAQPSAAYLDTRERSRWRRLRRGARLLGEWRTPS